MAKAEELGRRPVAGGVLVGVGKPEDGIGVVKPEDGAGVFPDVDELGVFPTDEDP
jgi:hypothetical protein